MGHVLMALERIEEAEDAYRRSLEGLPTSGRGLAGLAEVCMRLGRPEEAVTAGERAVEVSQGNPVATTVLAHALLAVGRSQEGWAAYEARFAAYAIDRRIGVKPRSFETPDWDGSSLADTSILVWGEGTPADEAHFAGADPGVAGPGPEPADPGMRSAPRRPVQAFVPGGRGGSPDHASRSRTGRAVPALAERARRPAAPPRRLSEQPFGGDEGVSESGRSQGRTLALAVDERRSDPGDRPGVAASRRRDGTALGAAGAASGCPVGAGPGPGGVAARHDRRRARAGLRAGCASSRTGTPTTSTT